VNIPHKILEEIKFYARSFSNEESCGVIVFDEEFKFIACENLSQNKDQHFSIDPFVLIENNVTAVYHSHVNSCCSPSCLDKKIRNNLQIPFLIYSLRDDNFCLY